MRKNTLIEDARALTNAQLRKYIINVDLMEDQKAKKIFKRTLQKEMERRTKAKTARTGIKLLKKGK